MTLSFILMELKLIAKITITNLEIAVTILQIILKDSKCKVIYNGKTGYLIEMNFNINSDRNYNNDSGRALTKTLTTDGKLRVSDSPLSNVIKIIPKGISVKVIENKDSYWKVIYNGKTGYLNEMYFNINFYNFKIEGNKFLKEKLKNDENWSNNIYYKYYLLSHEKIISEIFYLDLSKSKDVNEYYEIVNNEDDYQLIKKFVDLNNNGHKDLIIDNISRGYTGTGGYSTYIFVYKPEGYVFLQEFFGSSIEVKSTATNGFKDLIHSYKHYLDDGGFESVDEKMTWNGNKYIK